MSVNLYQNVELKLPLTAGHLRTRLSDWGLERFANKKTWEEFLSEAHQRDPRGFVFEDTEVIQSPYQINAILLQLELWLGIDVRLKLDKRVLDLWKGDIL